MIKESWQSSPDLDAEFEEEALAAQRLKRAIIREELVEITGDFLEGLILGQMLYWTERVRHFDAFLREELQIVQQDSGAAIEPLKGWFTKTAKQLNEELMLRMSEPTIRTKLKSLIEKRLLLERENPYQKWNRARQYRVSLLRLTSTLEQHGYHLEGYPKIGNLGSNLKFLASNQKILGTISKSNTKREDPLSKDNGNGSDEPCISHNDSSSPGEENTPTEENGSFAIVSIPQKDLMPHTAKAEQESDRVKGVKTPPQTSIADRVRKNLPKSNRALHPTKSEQLLSREAMPQCLQTWFTLSLVTKPTAKTYYRIVQLIHQLEQGKFPAQYKFLNVGFVEQHKIKPEHLMKEWTDKELAALLEDRFRLMIEDAACWPENKVRYFKGLSFESFVLNKKTGKSWLLGLLLERPQLLRKIGAKRTIERDLHPECTHEIAEALEISQKLHPEEYAGIVRNFSRIVQFFWLLPVKEGHERDGIFKFVGHPKTLAYSIAEFLRQQYGWVKEPGAGLIKLGGKPVRQWLEEWNDQDIWLPGRKRPARIWDLLDEYNQCGKLRTALVPKEASAPERHTSERHMEGQEGEDSAVPRWAEAELRRREEEVERHLAPDDIICEGGQRPEQERMWPRIKAALQRLKQGAPDPVVDESYVRF